MQTPCLVKYPLTYTLLNSYQWTSLPDAQAKLRSSIYYHCASYGQYCQYSMLILVTVEAIPDIKHQPAGSSRGDPIAIDKQTRRADQTRERIKA